MGVLGREKMMKQVLSFCTRGMNQRGSKSCFLSFCLCEGGTMILLLLGVLSLMLPTSSIMVWTWCLCESFYLGFIVLMTSFLSLELVLRDQREEWVQWVLPSPWNLLSHPCLICLTLLFTRWLYHMVMRHRYNRFERVMIVGHVVPSSNDVSSPFALRWRKQCLY